MSFSSKSSNGKHYRNAHHGNKHYQKKGFIGKLFDMIGSKSFSHSNYGNQYNNTPMHNQPIPNQNSINCIKCNSKIPVGSKFCLQCGEKVSDALFCMNCGEKLPPNSKFCSKCGNKVNK